MSNFLNKKVEEWEDKPIGFTAREIAAVNQLVNEYITMLSIRERAAMTLTEDYPKILYEVEKEIQEIRLILNTFLLDSHRD